MNEILEKQFILRFKGWSYQQRYDYILWNTFLDSSEFLLYLLLKNLISDWDRRHPKYTLFTYSLDQLIYHTHWKKWKIKQEFNKLIQKGCVEVIDAQNDLYRLVGLSVCHKYLGVKKDELSSYIGELLIEFGKASKTNFEILVNKHEKPKWVPIKNADIIASLQDKFTFNIVSYNGDIVSKNIHETIDIDMNAFDEYLKDRSNL